MGQTLGFISFGRVARAVAKRATPFGLRMLAYDPFIQETLISDHGVLPATLSEVLAQSDFLSMHAPARPEVHHMLTEKHFKQMTKIALFFICLKCFSVSMWCTSGRAGACIDTKSDCDSTSDNVA